VALDARSRVDPAVDLVAGKVLSSVGHYAVRPVAVFELRGKMFRRGVTLHAERVRMAAAAEVLGLGSERAVLQKKRVAVTEGSVGLKGACQFIVVAIEAIHLAFGQLLRVPGRCR
jgi:hypothetical protein